MIYKCDKCGRLVEQAEAISPGWVCQADLGFKNYCTGRFRPLPSDLSLLTRLLEVKGKDQVWSFRTLSFIEGNCQVQMVSLSLKTQTLRRVDFDSHNREAFVEALTKAYEWCLNN